jgi:hypothetical protein
MIMYISFYGFLKKSNFGSKSKVVSLRFYGKREFMAKTSRNSIFLGRKIVILDQLHVVVMYKSFYGF